ncbi:hypothetical protein GCM10011348_45860 [Marinobacterium nitratireducens]|uniref:Uncharacterized protein n=1 Tax=Marinobacterium nitratireducens TaxID=518897 RepID=A0A917ZQK1_9GAMM|nr:hypothetical protein [Marinobacterium nitratireducens]GGO89040.1 hypothetical protein GCM10011348_45860 [Marinobacterium nitratireducens]
MSNIETVRIVRKGHPHDYVVINKDDLAPDDVLYDDAPAGKASSIEIKRGQAGKYNVLVDGKVVTDEPVAKAEAEALANELRG